MSRTAPDHVADTAQALATEGGHLFIGHYGAILQHGHSRTSDPERGSAILAALLARHPLPRCAAAPARAA